MGRKESRDPRIIKNKIKGIREDNSRTAVLNQV